MCLTLVTWCMRLLLNSWCQLAKDMETLLNLMGTEEDPWGLQLKYVEMVTCCIMLFDTAVGGHIPDRRSHAQPGHLIARQLLWRVKSRPGGILASDPVGSHSADSPTRIHCHRCCAGAICQPALAATWRHLPEQCDTFSNAERLTIYQWWVLGLVADEVPCISPVIADCAVDAWPPVSRGTLRKTPLMRPANPKRKCEFSGQRHVFDSRWPSMPCLDILSLRKRVLPVQACANLEEAVGRLAVKHSSAPCCFSLF